MVSPRCVWEVSPGRADPSEGEERPPIVPELLLGPQSARYNRPKQSSFTPRFPHSRQKPFGHPWRLAKVEASRGSRDREGFRGAGNSAESRLDLDDSDDADSGGGPSRAVPV